MFDTDFAEGTGFLWPMDFSHGRGLFQLFLAIPVAGLSAHCFPIFWSSEARAVSERGAFSAAARAASLS